MEKSRVLIFETIDKNHVRIKVNKNGESGEIIALTLSSQGEKNLIQFLEKRHPVVEKQLELNSGTP